MKKLISILLVLVMLASLMSVVSGAAELAVSGNVIDIADKTVYSRSSYYAKAVSIMIDGASVEKATQDDTTVNIVLDGTTDPSAEIFVEFGTSLNRCIMTGHTASVSLADGSAQLVMTLKGQFSSMASWNSTVVYTLNFSLGVVPSEPPSCMLAADSAAIYSGMTAEFNLDEYFSGARSYYLMQNGQKLPLDGKVYTFANTAVGTHTLVFASSNAAGDCPDLLTVTVEVTEITSGTWLGIATSNGCVNYVKFTDALGAEIDGLKASLEDNSIIVTLPRSFDINEKITAAFDLTQNESGLPFISGSNAFNQGIGKTSSYTMSLSNGLAQKTLYLYNSKPAATNNNPAVYTLQYAVENEIPVLSDACKDGAKAEIVAGEAFTLDLLPIFADADGDTLCYSVKINGEAATAADANYSFMPTLGGSYELEFFASDFMASSAQSYKVILTVTNSDATYDMTVLLPDDIAPAFYITTGYDENGIDILGDTLTFAKGESADGFASYTVSVPENISEISVRDSAYGGMAFASSNESRVMLCKVQTNVTDLGGKAIDGIVGVSYGAHKALGVDGNFLLVPHSEYTFTASPADSSAYNKAAQSLTLTDDTNAVNIKLPYKNPKTIITTTGAMAKLFKFGSNYYVHTSYDPLASVDNGDGTSTHYFVADGNLSYRVSMDGSLTKAGYMLSLNSATVLHSPSDALPSSRVDYSSALTDASQVADDSLLLNINRRNHLLLDKGQTKTLKAYRAWEIINNYLNHIIEPDFNFNIISGEDVVRFAEYENQPMTNASGNWRKLTAIGEGTAIVEVTYDAISISGGAYAGLYGATDPARTGLFVVTVGADVPEVDFGIRCKTSAGAITYKESNAKPWDAEFDTVYFFGESGEINLSPTAKNALITEVAVSADKGKTFAALKETDGVYTAPIASGNNIIRVSTDKGVAYQIVRGDKTELLVKNLTNAGKPIAPGDKVSLTLAGVHTPVPKLSGTFNPGYSDNTHGDGRVHLHYSFGNESITSQGKQYDFSLNGTTMEFTVPSDASESSFTLTDGYIAVGVIGVTGYADDALSHRNIPDEGCNTRDDETTFSTHCLLPDITVSVGMLPSGNTAPFIRHTAPQTASITLGGTYALGMSKVFADRDGDEMTYSANTGEGETEVEDGYYTFTPDEAGTYTISFTADDGMAKSDVHTVSLTVNERASSGAGSQPRFDMGGSAIAGYVKISFEDNGKRVKGESNVAYPKALGTIISKTQVPFAKGDTVADVTLRLLDALGFSYEHALTTKKGFYLASIGDFTLKGVDYDSFGEFDAGSGSGWMITLNKKFIEYGASDFEVANGDVIKWQYTCQLGADIGDSFYEGTSSAKPRGKTANKTKDNQEQTEPTELAFDSAKVNALTQSVGELLYRTTPNPTVASIGGEWAVLGLSRSGLDIPKEYFENYWRAVQQYVTDCGGVLDQRKYTEYSRVIIALSAIGKNPADVAGYNLLMPLGDYDKTIRQGINGAIWALIALDCADYPMPQNPDANIQATREMYVNHILKKQTPDGGWALAGNAADPDVTAMALQALARYRQNDKVSAAIDRALGCLSAMQKESGGFESSESAAQVIVGLCSLGISISDERFVKNGNSCFDNLVSFYEESKGFRHTTASAADRMATEQCFYALVALKRASENKSSLYHMSDDVKTISARDFIKLKDNSCFGANKFKVHLCSAMCLFLQGGLTWQNTKTK